MAKNANSINQHDLINQLVEEDGLDRRTAYKYYDAFRDALLTALWDGKEVHLTRLAYFQRIVRPTRVGRNPATGESIEIPSHVVYRVRNRSDLNKIDFPVDENGDAVRESDVHPSVAERAERDARRAEREKQILSEREEKKRVNAALREQRRAEKKAESARRQYERLLAEAESARNANK